MATTAIKDKKMTRLSNICPSCGSNRTKKFNDRCTIMPENTTPHYFCLNCKTIWGIGRPKMGKGNYGQ